MGNRTRVPMEQPQTRALVNAALDYLLATHGPIIEVIVKDWIEEKDKRLAGLKKEKKTDFGFMLVE